MCLGNICGSTAAEAVVRGRIPWVNTDSAGMSGWQADDPFYRRDFSGTPDLIEAATEGLNQALETAAS